MTLPTHVPAREPLSDILRIAARLGLELLAAPLLVIAGFWTLATARSFVSRQLSSGTRRDVAFSLAPYGVLRRRVRHALEGLAGVRRRDVALPSRNPLSGTPSARTMPDPFRPVRATLCPGPFSTGHTGPLPYTSRARAMGVYGGVRSGDGARQPNRQSGAPCVPTTPDRSTYLSRDTSRARVMGVSGRVRFGHGARQPSRWSGAPPVPTTPDRSTHVSRDTSRARAMGLSGGVRSDAGAGGLRPARRHPCGQAGRLETRHREPLPPYRHRTAAPHVSRATYRARDGGVRWCTARRWPPSARAGRLGATRPRQPRKRALLP